MIGQHKQIEHLLDEIERESRESYARGWRDAIAALQAKAPEMAPIDPIAGKRGNGAHVNSVARERGRPEKAISLVRKEIFGEPGLRGVDIVRSLDKKGTPVGDRTVRCALRRLWQREGKWYPRPKEHSGAENELGEAFGSPPH